MKKLIFTICALMFVFTGCDLDEQPLDRLTPENYFNNEEELKSYTNTFYGQNYPSAPSVYGEQADVVITTTLQQEVAGTRIVPNKGGGWDTGDWTPLSYINTYLTYSHRCPDVNVRERYDAVARFFRAYFYFEKVKRFGDVPWYDYILKSNDPNLYKARDSRDFVMTKILEDIDYAIEKLPLTKDTYSVSRWTALALKSRICLFEGTFRKYHSIDSYENFLDECIKASEEFIDDSPYDIYTTGTAPYRDLFASNNASSTNTEVILARDYDLGLSIIHNANHYTLISTYGMPGLNKKIVDSYLMADGTRFTDKPNYATLGFFDEMQGRDPRLAQTIRTPGYKRINSNTVLSPDFTASTTGYQLIKWVTDETQDGYNKSYNDMILFRSAEVYLNFAEAKAERETLTQADLNKSVKLIRDRVGMDNLLMNDANSNPDPYLISDVTGYANVSGPNKGVILEIRRERTIELIDEGHRYYDVIRWKEGKLFEKPFKGMYFAPSLNANGYKVYDMDGSGSISSLDICLYNTAGAPDPKVFTELAPVKVFLKIGSAFHLTNGTSGNIISHDTATEPRTWREDRDYLYPIPISQIQLSSGAIEQNPNWQR